MSLCKKIASIALTATTIAATLPLSYNNIDNVKAAENKLTFTVMCDGTVVQETNGAEAFYKQLEEQLDCNIKWIRPEHSSYYDSVLQAFSSGDMPDVVLLSSEYLNYFASKGVLWDMTDAWNNSKTKNSGNLSASALNYVEENGMAYNKYNKKRMFGFSPQRGNGTCTYVKTSYLKTLGYNVDDVKNLTFSYMEYYAMLRKIKRLDPDSYVISSPGFISTQPPYTHYLPEFYEDAKFSFYQNKDGDYVDGFTEQSMRDALERITYAVKEGIIDKNSKDNSIQTARMNFLGRLTTNKSDTRSSKVFSYWNGIWGTTFRNMLELNSDDNGLVVMHPMHPSRYIERRTSTWAIVDKADGRQQLIFDKFIDTILDGGDVQFLWTYGAKGTHWDTKAETFTVRNNSYTYKEGEFHFLPRKDNPYSINSKNYIDCTLSLRPFDDDTLGGQLDKDSKNSNKYYENLQEETDMFLANSEIEPLVPCTEAYLKYNDEVMKIKKELVDKVALGEMTVDEAMSEYRSKAGSYVDSILEEFKVYSVKDNTIADVINNNNLKYTVKKDSSGTQMLSGVKPELKADSFKAGFGTNVTVKSADGKELSADATIGTGCVVELTKDNKVVDTVTVVVKGDTDGNSAIDVLDMEAIQKSILGIGDKLSGAYKEAATLTEDSADITVLDMEAIQKDILGIQKIN